MVFRVFSKHPQWVVRNRIIRRFITYKDYLIQKEEEAYLRNRIALRKNLKPENVQVTIKRPKKKPSYPTWP